MANRTIRIVVDGATGRLGGTQHFRSLLAIRAEGGLPLRNGDRLMPEPILLGRNAEKLARMAVAEKGWKTKLDVVAMKGWRRGDWWDSTGLPWINPSPNIRSLTAAMLFPTPMSFLISTARNARSLADRSALALGLIVLPLLVYADVGLDLMWTGIIAGTAAYGIHRWRGARP